MSELAFAMFGAGFWSQYQLAAWQELRSARCIAICDPIRSKAEALAERFGIPNVCEAADELFESNSPDFIDIVTNVETHAELVSLALSQRTPVICQKPMAPTLKSARVLVAEAQTAGVPFLIHENWRWQTPLRKLEEILASGELGDIVRARIDYANSFPVFDNQPFLKELEQFILTDIGTHILDTARFLFGEARNLYCQTRQMRSDIRGEDVATVILETDHDLTVTCNMSYASRWEHDRFPQTLVTVEGTRGGASLCLDYKIRVFGDQPRTIDATPQRYDWADPAYDLIHASIVDCHRNLLSEIEGTGKAETAAADNLRTLELVFASYESAATKSVVRL